MKKILLAAVLLLMGAGFNPYQTALAQDPLIDEVDTATEAEWAEIRIHFITPVNYVRHFPQEHGQLLEIFFTVSGLDLQNISLREDTHHVAATPIMPDTVITYGPPASLNIQRDPSTLSIRFDRDVNYDVKPGDDNRSLVIYIHIVPVENKPPKTSPKAKEKPPIERPSK